MSEATATRMDAAEIDEFLASRETGVLSLANDDDAYGIPLSFAYDEAGLYVYFRLGYAPGSRKRRFVDAAEQVSFVVYDRADGVWKSVVARGRLEEVSTTNLDSVIVETARELEIPYFQVHDRPMEELDVTIARIEVSELSGIVGAE